MPIYLFWSPPPPPPFLPSRPERANKFAYSSLVPFHSAAAWKEQPGMRALRHDWLLCFFICKLESRGFFLFFLWDWLFLPSLLLCTCSSPNEEPWAHWYRNSSTSALKLIWIAGVWACVFFSQPSTVELSPSPPHPPLHPLPLQHAHTPKTPLKFPSRHVLEVCKKLLCYIKSKKKKKKLWKRTGSILFLSLWEILDLWITPCAPPKTAACTRLTGERAVHTKIASVRDDVRCLTFSQTLT